MLFEFVDASLEITIDLDIACNDAFHPTDVFIDVILNLSDTLDIRYELTLLS
jgi:hypothetical protein